MEHNHKHIIATGFIDVAPAAQDIEKINAWFCQLVDAIGMKILIPPKTVYSDTVGNEGATGICCIDTSHSSIHFWAKSNLHDRPFFKFDLYSCRDFSTDTIIEFAKKLGATRFVYTVIDRNDDYNPIIESGEWVLEKEEAYV